MATQAPMSIAGCECRWTERKRWRQCASDKKHALIISNERIDRAIVGVADTRLEGRGTRSRGPSFKPSSTAIMIRRSTIIKINAEKFGSTKLGGGGMRLEKQKKGLNECSTVPHINGKRKKRKVIPSVVWESQWLS